MNFSWLISCSKYFQFMVNDDDISFVSTVGIFYCFFCLLLEVRLYPPFIKYTALVCFAVLFFLSKRVLQGHVYL